MKWLRTAFHVDKPGPAEPNDAQREVIDWFCREVARRHLTVPAIITLEMFRPLNYLTAQTMHFVAPGVWAVLRDRNYAQYQELARYLEQRGSVEYIARRLEAIEAGDDSRSPQTTDHPEDKSPPPSPSNESDDTLPPP